MNRVSRLPRLSSLDASNLRVEARGLPMNVAAVMFLEPGGLMDASEGLDLDAVRVRVARRLHRASRLRQKLCTPPFGFGPPVWIDDAAFDIRHHIRSRAVPPPGDEETVLRTCAELNEQRFDRSRPLWEIWFLTGLRDGTIAMLIRFHHVVADGMAALLLLGSLFDDRPDTGDPSPHAWTPYPPPTRRALFVDNVRGRMAAVVAGLAHIADLPAVLGRLRAGVAQLRRLRREGQAPRLSFNRPVGPHHRLRFVRADLERTRAVAHAHGGTINDVVLTAMSGGARALLARRGELVADLVLKVSVATSVRAAADDHEAANLVAVMVVPVPVDEPDPVRRLQVIARAAAERKRLPPYQPAGRFLQRWMVRTMAHQHLVNLLASNLPGPPERMFFLGAEVREVFQIGVVQGNLTVTVGVLSYAGQLNFDILGDLDAVPDLDTFAQGATDDLERLGVGRARG